MSTLKTLDDKPLDWPTLHARNEAYWAARAADETFSERPLYLCANCHERRPTNGLLCSGCYRSGVRTVGAVF